MSKRILCTLISILMVMVLLPGVASAKGNGKGGGPKSEFVSETRKGGGAKKIKIKVKANKPGKAADKEFAKLEKMVEQANKKVEQLVKKAQKTPYDDVEWLLNEVEKTVRPVFEFGAKIGVTVVCEYVEYYVDGQYVLIDPIRIIRL